MSDIQIVRYEPRWKEQVALLQRHLWSPDPGLNLKHLEWKYEQNPYLDQPLAYLALIDGRVVGMRGMSGALWQVGESRVPVLCACDLVILPEHRNRGLLKAIMTEALRDLAVQGHEYLFGLSSSPVTFMASLALGFHSVGSMDPLVRRWPRSFFRRRIRAKLRKLPLSWRFADTLPLLLLPDERSPFTLLDRAWQHRGVRAPERVTVERTPRTGPMSDLVQRLPVDDRIRHVRDARYFDWRYRNPLVQHRFIYAGDPLEGYLVVEQSTSAHADRTRTRIVDWEAADARVFHDMMRVVIEFGGFEEVVTWSAGIRSQVREGLQALGFSPLEEPDRMSEYRNRVVVRALQDQAPPDQWALEGKPLLERASWDLRMLQAL